MAKENWGNCSWINWKISIKYMHKKGSEETEWAVTLPKRAGNML